MPNIPLGVWGRYLGDAILARSILDRLVMRAIRININGPSYRQQVAKDRAQALGAKPDDDLLQQ